MPFIGELSALATACLWGISALIFTSVVVQTGPISLNINRMILAVVWGLLAVLLLRIPVQVSRTQVFYLALSGVAELVFCDTLVYKAFQTIGARITMVIVSLGPAISTLLAYAFLREVLPIWAIMGIVMTLIGIMLVVSERTSSQAQRHISGRGVVFALLATLGQGVGIILSKQAFLEGPIHGLVASLIRMSVGLLVLLPVALFLRRYPNPIHMFIQRKKTFLVLLVGSFVGPFLGITLSLVAIAHAQVGIAATLLATSPIMMLPMVRVVHKEVLSWKAIVGACVAVGGVAMLFLT